MPFPFGELPAELRLEVYRNLLPKGRVYVHHEDILPSGKAAILKRMPLACTCRQIQSEIVQLLIKDKLLVFYLPSPFDRRSVQIGLARSVTFFGYIQAVYETIALSEEDRVALVECEYVYFYYGHGLEHANYAPAVKKWRFVISNFDQPGVAQQDNWEHYHQIFGMHSTEEEYEHMEEFICNPSSEWLSKGLLFEIEETPRSSRWTFEKAGQPGGWEIVGWYEEDAQVRRNWIEFNTLTWKYHYSHKPRYRINAGRT
ncbi:MAG: hypothetical protein Q9165_008084 [Trypethelium subeluteriae]